MEAEAEIREVMLMHAMEADTWVGLRDVYKDVDKILLSSRTLRRGRRSCR